MSSPDPRLLAHKGIVPDQVRRLHLAPEDTLVVLVNGLTPAQMRGYQGWLEAVFPGNPVRVLIGQEVLVLRPGAEDDPGGPDA